MVYLAQGNVSWFAASVANLESTPATELPRGVNIGVAYFDLLGQKFPRDFYKIRAFADAKQVGRLVGDVMKTHKGLAEAADVKRIAEELLKP